MRDKIAGFIGGGLAIVVVVIVPMLGFIGKVLDARHDPAEDAAICRAEIWEYARSGAAIDDYESSRACKRFSAREEARIEREVMRAVKPNERAHPFG